MRLQYGHRICSHEPAPHVCYSYSNPLSWQRMADKRHHVADASHTVSAVGNRPYINLEFITDSDRCTLDRSSHSTGM
jgi:hypothetical protein